MEREFITPKTAPVLLKDAPASADWMAAFRPQPLPSMGTLAKEAQLPAVIPMAMTRSAVAQGDTLEGVVRTAPLDKAMAEALHGDPRVEQLRRMLARDAQGLRMTTAGAKTMELSAAPKAGDPRAVVEVMGTPQGMAVAQKNATIPGKIALPDPREPDAPTLLAFTQEAITRRAATMPPALRARMAGLRESLDAVKEARRAGLGTDALALSHTADVAERAFVLSEGAKPQSQRLQEAREKGVDPLFAAAATASRAASREGYKDSFQRGLVSDVVACEQGARLHEGRPAREGDDWVGAAQRLRRVGLIDADDARAQVRPEPVKALAQQPEPVRLGHEKAAIKEAFADPSVKDRTLAAAKEEVKREDKSRLAIEHQKPKEATAETSVSQVGLSGAYLVAEVSRDNANASKDRKMEAAFEAAHAKRVAEAGKKIEDQPQAAFGRAAVLESAGVKAQAAGKPAAATNNVMALAAAAANSGVTAVHQSAQVRAQLRRPEATREEQR